MAIPNFSDSSEPAITMLHQKRWRQQMWWENMEMISDWRISMFTLGYRFKVPCAQGPGESRNAQLDPGTILGFRGSTVVSNVFGWKLLGVELDDPVLVTMDEAPLRVLVSNRQSSERRRITSCWGLGWAPWGGSMVTHFAFVRYSGLGPLRPPSASTPPSATSASRPTLGATTIR